ncbi:leucine-rich repeat receptor-like serine/threonine/tyrosine-protein kinase sobir1 [Phtheirospermum japonicum]|uniref:Leucine-rich repeat receptor-like serine/threonine/tyrosine-protein kinase sobir1 n=1 Tax=Phtheirospermum japonicum TaxID=374723 RepID=A0A830CJ67_9LAMI|nr:leucine-rich repeat receptor-like serine/threonine/tyrosine-protein kinase sobir1 [Phtheirospermum japonicum]
MNDPPSSLPARYVFAESPQRKNQSSSAAIAPSPSQSSNGRALSPTTPPKKKHMRKRKKIVAAILGLLAGILAGSVSGVVFALLFKLLMLLVKGRKRDTSLRIFSPMIKNHEDLAFLEKDDGLASLPVIGRGGCGEVYKSVLPSSNGREIAIKKIIQPARDAEELTEEDSKDCLRLVAEGKRELDWLARYKIALGIAAGLEYLHMNHSPRIIHRDLKPANVLLDDEMEARIADFGLAKAVPDANTHVTTSNVAGTVGYIAPEYYQTFKFTDKCDMYSFGVVLGVLVIGKLPSDDYFQQTEEVSLVKWMRNLMTNGDPKRAIDKKMLGNGYEEQMMLVLKIACFCTLDNPKERPNSKDARCMLSQIKH